MGNVLELTEVLKKSQGCPCRKLDKDTYFDTRTGDVFNYNHIENRSGSVDSIRRTLGTIRGLLNSNILNPACVRWVTLTYKENMRDTKRLYTDFEKFWKRFKYYCSSKKLEKPQYISVIEPQGRGAWHIHAFFIWDNIAPFIPNSTLAELWSHGFTKIKACDNCDNVGAYFSAYLADMPLDDVNKLGKAEQVLIKSSTSENYLIKDIPDDDGNITSKQVVKGGRLYLYPTGMNIVRYSKGVKKPIIESLPQKTAQKKVSSAKLTFESAYQIDKDGTAVNTISKAYYNRKAK